MAYRDPQLLHLDRDLTNISAGFDPYPEGYLSDIFAPTVRVSNQSDKYRVYNRDLWGRQTDDIRAPGGQANELPPMTFSRDSYFTQEHALVDVVPREDETNADADLDSLGDSTERLTNTVMLNRELTALAMATNVSNYASGFTVTLSGTSQWSDYANSAPISDVKTGVDAIVPVLFRPPNTTIMGYYVWRKLEDHPDILDRIKVGTAITTKELVQQVFGLPGRMEVAMGGYVNAAWGVADANSNVSFTWGKDVLMAWVPPAPGRRIPSFMYEFARPVGSANGEIMPTERWYDIDRKADKVRTSREYVFKFITVDSNSKSAGAGYLIKNAVA